MTDSSAQQAVSDWPRRFSHFSRELLQLDGMSCGAGLGSLMGYATQSLQRLVPFDAAWWGECSVGNPSHIWLDGNVRLPATFEQQWRTIAPHDRFARRSRLQVGKVIVSSTRQRADPATELTRRSGFEHIAGVTHDLEGSGLLFFFVLFRHGNAAAFSEVDQALFREFSLQIVSRFRRALSDVARQAGRGFGDGHALADQTGTLLYVGARMGHFLRERLSLRAGSTLPATLLSAATGESRSSILKVGRQLVEIVRVSGLTLLDLDPPERPSLSPRKRHVAELYARGQTYLDIAKETGLTPATVRTYLRSAYGQLNVTNKVELCAALRTTAERAHYHHATERAFASR